MKKIVILFSGAGSNLENIVRVLHKKKFHNNHCEGIEIVAAITNRPEAKGIEKATRYDIPTVVLDHTHFKDRDAYDRKLVKVINALEADLVVMAGFMRLVTPYFTQSIEAINIHPSLLPKYKGMHAIDESFTSNDTEAGVTVHWVNENLDAGEIIMQQRFDKKQTPTREAFEKKIKEIEHQLYPEAIKKVLGCKTL